MSDYHKEYYIKNKDKFRSNSKEYRKKNKEEIAAKKKAYYSDPVNRQRKAQLAAASYLRNRETVLERQSKRRKERLEFINNIAMMYGCQNPDCGWTSPIHPVQLSFHHFDPSQKVIEIAKMESWSYKKIIDEINKCVVLCRNCHPLADKGMIAINESMICKIEKDTL